MMTPFHNSNKMRAATNHVGAVIDIDGVLMRGSQPVQGAREALGRLPREHWVLVTNGGGVPTRAKEESVEKVLGLTPGSLHGRLVAAHDPIPSALRARGLWNQRVLVLSKNNSLSRAVAHDWHLPNPLFLDTLEESSPWLWPLRDDGRPIVPDPVPVAAICVVATPEDWGMTLQLCCDLIRHGGLLYHDGRPSQPSVPIFVSNPDFDYRARPPVMRMTTGAWLCALHALLAHYNQTIEPILLGKPHRPIYDMALERLPENLDTVYCIGDNPISDILGARNFPNWRSILVLTGVAQADNPEIPAHHVCADIGSAVDLILQRHALSRL